jgi:hypothetical protein
LLNYKRLAIIAAVVFAALAGLFFIIKIGFAAGIMAGFLTGVISFTMLVLTVKSLLKEPNKNSLGTALLAVLIYLLKIAVIGAILAVIIVYRKHFDLRGFLIGFTISLLILLAENVIVIFNNSEKKKLV